MMVGSGGYFLGVVGDGVCFLGGGGRWWTYFGCWWVEVGIFWVVVGGGGYFFGGWGGVIVSGG